jgi:hypothetical protein
MYDTLRVPITSSCTRRWQPCVCRFVAQSTCRIACTCIHFSILNAQMGEQSFRVHMLTLQAPSFLPYDHHCKSPTLSDSSPQPVTSWTHDLKSSE